MSEWRCGVGVGLSVQMEICWCDVGMSGRVGG